MFKNKKPMMPKSIIPRTHSEFHPVSPNEIRTEIQRSNPDLSDGMKNLDYDPPMETIKSEEDRNESFYNLVDQASGSYCNASGYAVNPTGYINPITFEDDLKGLICARAFITNGNPYDTKYEIGNALIANTENGNFRYVSIDENNRMVDLGHVNHACIVGNAIRPDGLYVPFNPYAINDGACMLTSIIDKVRNELLDNSEKNCIEEDTSCNCDEDCNDNCMCNGTCKSDDNYVIPQPKLESSHNRKPLRLEECKDILTAEEACSVLRIGYNALYELLNSGELKAFRNGRLWRIPKQAILEFIRDQTNR